MKVSRLDYKGIFLYGQGPFGKSYVKERGAYGLDKKVEPAGADSTRTREGDLSLTTTVIKIKKPREGAFLSLCSPGWTRTSNPSVTRALELLQGLDYIISDPLVRITDSGASHPRHRGKYSLAG